MILALRQDAALATPPSLAAVLKTLPLTSYIGAGAPHTDNEGTVWLLYGPDARWTLEDVAYNGWALAHPEQLADLDVETLGAEAVRAEVRDRADAGGVVLPDALDLSESANPWEDVLRAQGAPESVRMLLSVEGWTPEGESF